MSEDDRLGFDTACPYCGKHIDAAMPLDGEGRPEKGSFSVCADCGEVAVFGEGLQLRKRTEDEPLPPELERHIRAVRAVVAVVKLLEKFRG